MRKLLRRVAHWLGITTSYHVAATYQQDSHVGFSVLAITVTMRPWLHADNYNELVEFIKNQATRPASTPSITSITKLGI
jgi:hypothetical protein